MSADNDTNTELASRQVINNALTTDRFWRDYSTMDVAAIFGPPVVLLTIGRILNHAVAMDVMPVMYAVSIALLLAWGSLIYVLPSWETPSDFVSITFDRLMTPNTYDHVEHTYNTGREQKHESPAKWWHTDTRTQDLTRVDEFPLGGDVVRRRDGQLVGAIEVSSTNMTLAGREKWAENVDKFEDFLENTLDFDFTIYSPTRRFRKGHYVNQQRDRLQDEDVRTNPVLEAMCADYADWLDVKLGGSSTATRETYVMVAVSEHDVRYLEDEETIEKNLSGLPLIGRLFRRFDDSEVSDEELFERQVDEVNRRLKSVQMDCINDLSGCSSNRITGGTLAELIYSHWEGEEFEGDMDALLRQYPVVTTEDIQETYREQPTAETATGN